MSVDPLPWLDYRWSFDVPAAMLPAIGTRLGGTPARLEELLRDAPDTIRQRPAPDIWSIQEHAGHLVAVETLWRVRIDEYLAGAATLTAADMSNRRTEGANWNDQPLAQVLTAFRSARTSFTTWLASLTLADAERVAHHPRLDRPMRLVDLCLFAAEHDDHHLALIAARLAALRSGA
jgi:uncharacterized damage-inducible protein DinB